MIYIACPANLQTGGPEVLHQLGYKLNLFGIEANMLYANRKEGVNPVCECYRKYNVPYCTQNSICDDSIIILPEMVISLACHFQNHPVVIWWLSVDYAKYTEQDVEYMLGNPNIYHLVQSQYAFEHLRDKLKITERVYYLSDYLNSAFFDPAIEVDDSTRENVVLFNPKKGINKTANLIMRSDYRIKWQALCGLTPAGMRETMRKAKVYIDFGEHPGKDRIPREAAMCGCCVITNKNGAALNEVDVSIPQKYKFENECEEEKIFQCIYDIFDNYSNVKKDYLPYINKISSEFNEFEKDIIKFFSIFVPDVIQPADTPEQYIEYILSEIQKEQFGRALLYLVNYRIQGYEESVILDILEVVIRMGIKEFAEAEICAFRGLEKAPDNYELYLNLAQIGFITGDLRKFEKYALQAIEYSKGTPDEEYVANVLRDCGYEK